MFNCHGEPVSCVELETFPPSSTGKASTGKAGLGELVDPTQHGKWHVSAIQGEEEEEQSEQAEVAAPERKPVPWWYRLLVPSDFGTIATLGEFTPADVIAAAVAAHGEEDNEDLALQHEMAVIAEAKGQLDRKISTKIDLECITVVGKAMVDWEPEPEAASSEA